jgi:hypothetical protein
VILLIPSLPLSALVAETYDSSPKEFSSPRSYKNQTSTSNGSTASVSVHSLPLPNQPIGTKNQQDALSESSKRVPTSTSVTASVASSSTRIRSNREIADVTELDTSVGSAEKKILPQTRSFTETQTNVSTSASAPASKPPQSRHELRSALSPPPLLLSPHLLIANQISLLLIQIQPMPPLVGVITPPFMVCMEQWHQSRRPRPRTRASST